MTPQPVDRGPQTANPDTALTVSALLQAKREFAEAGGVLTHKAVSDRLTAADQRAAADVKADVAPPDAAAAERIRWLLGKLAIVFVGAVMVGGVLLALVALPAAEITSVAKGLDTITDDDTIVALTSLSLLLAVLVLPFLKYAYADAMPSKPKGGLLRRVAQVAAWLGIPTEGTRLPLLTDTTNLQRNYAAVSAALLWTKVAVIGASAIGRLAPLFETYGDQPVGDAWASIVAGMTGTELIGLVVSLGVLWAILAILDTFVLFVYVSFKNTAGALDLGDRDFLASSRSYEDLREAYQIEVLRDMTVQLQANQTRRLQASTTPVSPDVVTIQPTTDSGTPNL